MEEITVTPALETEAAACFALLPEAAGWPVELLVAKRGHAAVGAAALRWRNASDPPGFPLSLHVLPPDRRQGIGRRLLRAAVDLAGQDACGLWSLNAVVEGDPGAHFLLASGFTSTRRERHFEADFDALLAVIGPMADRLRGRGRVPSDLKIVPLAEAPREDLVHLLARELGAVTPGTTDQLAQRAKAPGQTGDRSRVALRNGVLEGAILWQVSNGVALVEARVVHPRNRGSWLNVMLLEDGLVRGKAEGIQRMRFHCMEAAWDTVNLAKRCCAEERQTRAYYYLGLDN